MKNRSGRTSLGKCILIAAFAAVGVFPFAAKALNVSTGAIKPGEWNANFTAGKKYAEQYNMPMVLLWSSGSCPNCATLKDALDTSWVDAWVERRQMVMIQDTDGDLAKEFARNNTLQYPYVCVYWPKTDGTATTNRFTGISGHMPVTSGTLAEQFMASVDLFTEGYEGIYKFSEFKVSGGDGDRLEAIPGKTKFVDVPLVRSEVYAEAAAETFLIEMYPDGRAPITNIVNWAAGENAKTVRVAFPGDFAARAGDVVELALTDASSTERKIGHVTFVAASESGLSPVDPLWIGEEFKFGRFTFDYDAATNAVAVKRAAGEKAYTLVLFTGSLWCPYCKGMETSLLADSRFYEWAESNNVALVEFDQGRASTPATAAGTLAPRLLTYEPDPRLVAPNAVSGAGYISRHSVEALDAEAEIARTTAYTAKWLAPEATAARLSQPTILLIENDEVKARFTAQRNAARVYDAGENIARLGDFLLLADGDGESSNYATTTPLVHNVGDSSTSRFQISDRTDFYRIYGLSAGRLDVSVAESSELSSVVFSLIADGAVLAVGTNGLSAAVSQECLAAEKVFLRLTAFADTSALIFAGAGVTTTVFDFAFSTSIVLVPEEKSNSVPVAGDVNIEVESGVVYKLSGFSGAGLTSMFSDNGGGLFTALSSGVVQLAAASGAKYQKWRPGEVAFAETSLEADESDGMAVLVVQRTGGSSGGVRVKVVLDAEGSDAVPVERYEWSDTELFWDDGESDERVVSLRLLDDYVADETQTLRFTLTKVSGEDGISVSSAPCAVAITDHDDKESAGRIAIVETTPKRSTKTTVYAREGSDVSIQVARLDGAVGAAVVRLVPSCESCAPIEFAWTDRDRTSTRDAMFTLPTMSDCPSGKVTFALEGSTIPTAWGATYVTVVLVAADAPSFASQSANMSFARYVESASSVQIEGVAPGSDVSVAKVSGTLPPGLNVGVSGGMLTISGTPTAVGSWDSVYQVIQVVEGEKTRGMTLDLTVTVTSPVEEKNESVVVTRTLTDIPVYNPALKRMTGLLTVTIPATGRLSAKYRCAEGVRAMTAANWTFFDEKSGAATANLMSRDGKCRLSITVASSGAISGTLVDPAYPYDDLTVSSTGASWSRTDTAEAWAGLYTVAFVPTARISGGEGVAHTGCAAFMLKMTSSTACRSGRFIVSGKLPNGKSISASATLVAADANAKSALLPLFFRSSSEVFSGLPEIASGAQEAYAKSGDHRAITASTTADSTWLHTDLVTDAASFAMSYKVYGAYYDPSEDLAGCLEATEVSNQIALTVNADELSASVMHGDIDPPVPVILTVSDSGIAHSAEKPFTLGFASAKGTVSGKIPVSFADGRTVTASWFGVVLPGWTGCGCTEGQEDLPFILGTCWFDDAFLYTHQEGCTEESEKDSVTSIRRGCSVTGETTAL